LKGEERGPPAAFQENKRVPSILSLCRWKKGLYWREKETEQYFCPTAIIKRGKEYVHRSREGKGGGGDSFALDRLRKRRGHFVKGGGVS